MVWFRDSQRLLFDKGDGLYVMDVSKRTSKLLPIRLDGIIDVSISDDERWLYLLLHSEDDDIWLAELQ